MAYLTDAQRVAAIEQFDGLVRRFMGRGLNRQRSIRAAAHADLQAYRRFLVATNNGKDPKVLAAIDRGQSSVHPPVRRSSSATTTTATKPATRQAAKPTTKQAVASPVAAAPAQPPQPPVADAAPSYADPLAALWYDLPGDYM